MKQHLKGRQYGHEKRTTFARTQGLQVLRQPGGDVEKNIRAVEGLEGWSGSVRWQVQHGKRAVQLLLPKLDLLGVGAFIGHHFLLPKGKVAILHGQFGWTRSTTLGERPIKRVQFIQ